MNAHSQNHQLAGRSAEPGSQAAPAQANSAPNDAATDPADTDAAARSVMHPDWHDTDWRYYFGAWGG
jgi:hypothetical protein